MHDVRLSYGERPAERWSNATTKPKIIVQTGFSALKGKCLAVSDLLNKEVCKSFFHHEVQFVIICCCSVTGRVVL